MAAITTLRNGVPIGYDPDTGKWFAEIDGKRATSQDFSVLANRMDAREKLAKKAPAEVFEVTTLALSQGTSRHPTPVKLQLEWNGKTGRPEIKKYQMLTPGQGWRESEREKLIVVNPFSPPAVLKNHLANLHFNSAVDAAYKTAEMAVAGAWVSAKNDCTSIYKYQTHRSPGLVAATEKDIAFGKKISDKRNLFKLNSAGAMEVVPYDPALHTQSNWAPTPEGPWMHFSGRVRIRLVISHSSPSFEVEEKSNDDFHQVYSTRDFNEALLVGGLTHRFKAEEAVTTWESKDEGVVGRNSVSWPDLVELRGTAFVTKENLQASIPNGSVTLFQLCRKQSNPVSSYASASKGWQWERREGDAHYGALPTYFTPGPEDQALDALLALKEKASSLQKEDLKFDLEKALASVRQDWVEALYEANLNGEWENPSEEAVRIKLEQTQAALKAGVEKDPALQAFRTASAEMAANAEVLVAPPAPRSRGPRPGR